MIEKRRDELKRGDVFRSSHGYDLLVGSVDDSAEVRTDERHVGITGFLHADPAMDGSVRSERYSAGSTVEVYSFEEFVTARVERANQWANFGVLSMSEKRLDRVEERFAGAAHALAHIARLAAWGRENGQESYTFSGMRMLVEGQA